jgi:hypothetical protein
MSVKVFCSECGQQVVSDARFCRHCGAEQVKSGLTVQRPIPVDLVAASQPPAPTPTSVADDPAPTVVLPPAAPPYEPAPAPAYEPVPPLRDPWAEDHRTPTPPPPPFAERAQAAARNAGDRVEQAAPGAGELAGQLTAQLRTPAVAGALAAAGVTFALMLAVGLVLAVLPSHNSLFLLDVGSVVNRMLLYAATFTSAPMDTGGVKFQQMPMLFVALPLGGMALAAYARGTQLSGHAPWQRLAAGAAGALPLAVLVVIVASAAKIDSDGATVKADAGAVFGLTLLWGVIGGLAGAGLALRRDRPGSGVASLPAMARPAARAAGATLRPLAIALLLATVVGTGVVVLQTLTDQGQVKGQRSTLQATVENVAYAPEHGLHVLALGSFAQIRTPLPAAIGLPIPVAHYEKLLNLGGNGDVAGASKASVRAFDYSDAVPSWIFLLGVLAAIAIPLLFALYAGFAAARAAGATTLALGAAWGAITGPVWALLLVVLESVANKTDSYAIWGLANGGSVFGFALLIGVVLGSLGGLLAVQGRPAVAAPPPPQY